MTHCKVMSPARILGLLVISGLLSPGGPARAESETVECERFTGFVVCEGETFVDPNAVMAPEEQAVANRAREIVQRVARTCEKLLPFPQSASGDQKLSIAGGADFMRCLQERSRLDPGYWEGMEEIWPQVEEWFENRRLVAQDAATANDRTGNDRDGNDGAGNDAPAE